MVKTNVSMIFVHVIEIKGTEIVTVADKVKAIASISTVGNGIEINIKRTGRSTCFTSAECR